MTYNSSTYYLSYDQVGSLRLVSDASGNIVKQISYDSFGNIINDSNPSFNVPFGFAGGLHDRDTGLVRFGARDYDPTIGKWTAKDPIDFAGDDTNLYGYVGNNPVNWVDPWGLYTWPYTWMGWTGVALILAGPPLALVATPVVGISAAAVGSGLLILDTVMGFNKAEEDIIDPLRPIIEEYFRPLDELDEKMKKKEPCDDENQ